MKEDIEIRMEYMNTDDVDILTCSEYSLKENIAATRRELGRRNGILKKVTFTVVMERD